MTDLTVATTILQQLGGKRFILMTGAKNVGGGSDYLSFTLPKNSKKISHVLVKYNKGSDTYSMKFMNVRGVNVKNVATYDDVYCDMLQELFTKETGFYTTL
jgi:hypothetical protein